MKKRSRVTFTLTLIPGILLVALLFANAAFPASLRDVHCVVSAVKRMLRPLGESSVEIEIRFGPKALSLITTTDGSIGPLLQDHPIPDYIRAIAKRKRIEPENISSIPFDWLLDSQKIDLINLSKETEGGKALFFWSRKIPGLTTRDSVQLRFPDATRFLGQDYPAGVHTVDLSKALQKYVEYGSPEDLVNPIGGLELHLRGDLPASQMVESAWALETGVGLERSHKHVHITSPVPWRKLREAPGTTAAIMTDFHRRANMAAEMLAIVEEGLAISKNAGNGYTSFGSLLSSQLKSMVKDWRTLGMKNSSDFGTYYKISYMGMRGPGFYDNPNIWGEEVRSLTRRTSSRNARALLDAIQDQMDGMRYLESEDRIQRWIAASDDNFRRSLGGLGRDAAQEEWAFLRKLTGEWEGDLLYRAHYQKDWAEIVREVAPARIKKEFSWLVKKMPASAKSHDEIKMLFHDWSLDPLFFDRPEKAAEIVNRQVHALRRLARRDGTVNEIMKEFLISSGIYREMLESVGMRLRYKITLIQVPKAFVEESES